MRPPIRFANEDPKRPLVYSFVEWFIWKVSPKYTLHGTEKLPEEACVIVGNHCQMYGPIAAEFYMPRDHYIWCVGEMMNRKEVPAYAFQDFWSMKPRWTHWFFRILSHVIAPLADLVFNHAHTIPVYHDMRVIQTIRKSIGRLDEGADVVIFPETHEPYNGILWQFQTHFADLGQMYYRKTGKAVCFVPMYTAPKLKEIWFGEPVRYAPETTSEEERERICTAVMTGITDLATALPEHRVVPYQNIKKRDYPLNTECDRKSCKKG